MISGPVQYQTLDVKMHGLKLNFVRKRSLVRCLAHARGLDYRPKAQHPPAVTPLNCLADEAGR